MSFFLFLKLGSKNAGKERAVVPSPETLSAIWFFVGGFLVGGLFFF